ncbi:MAG TPA: isochorismatase family cysteine hydrolase [Tissierellaceae bacterium]
MKKNMLLVVDYQNDFVNGSLGFDGAEKLDELIVEKILEYGEGNVLYAQDTHDANYLETREGKNLPVEHCIKNTKGWQIYGDTKKALEKVDAKGFEKTTFGIDPKDLEEYKGIDTLEIAGLVTNMCVISNVCVFQAISPETQIVVDAKLCDSFDRELHEKALDVLEGLQVKVINR